MATVASVSKDLAKVQPKSIQDLIQSSVKELGRALPSHLKSDRLVRIALTCIRLNPDLSNCTPESFLGSLFVLAQLGLEPVAGRAYLLPFTNNRKVNGTWTSIKEVQAIIGYKGLIDLFYRHESALSIDMQTVYEKDSFSYQYGTESFLKHQPAMKDRGEVIGYYAVGKIKGGGSLFFFMSKEDAIAHGKKHSKTFDEKTGKFHPSSPWSKEPDAMCMKTVLIQLAKRLPLSVELQRAIAVDESSRDYRAGVEDALDLPPTTEWHEGEVVKEEPKDGEAKGEFLKAEFVPVKTTKTELPVGEGGAKIAVWMVHSADDKFFTVEERVADGARFAIDEKSTVIVKYGKDQGHNRILAFETKAK